jgi:hypothetical protein
MSQLKQQMESSLTKKFNVNNSQVRSSMKGFEERKETGSKSNSQVRGNSQNS